MEERNVVRLCGQIGAKPIFSHAGRDGYYYVFPLNISRLSGAFDAINVVAREERLEALGAGVGQRVFVGGTLRSYNNKSGKGSRLVITVSAGEIYETNGADENSVVLTGALCKAPILRRTPMGRQICDIMLAVNRRYGRSDYLPCICWGRCAEEAGAWPVGAEARIEGRVQSRRYIKMIDGQQVEKTAFEVSAAKIERIWLE